MGVPQDDFGEAEWFFVLAHTLTPLNKFG
jgi:hypothetical protein